MTREQMLAMIGAIEDVHDLCLKQKTVPSGQYPEISLADARTAHQAARTELTKGNDPMAQLKAIRMLSGQRSSRNR